MKYEETYYGHRIVVTTTKNPDGRWTFTVAVPDGPSQPHAQEPPSTFSSEEEARRDALSKAAAMIDRARQGRGKP